MATAPTTLTSKVEALSKGIYRQSWTATAAGVGNPYIGPGLAGDMTFQLAGPTGGTSSIAIEGTNESTPSTANWFTLEAATGGTISYTNVTGGMLVAPNAIPYAVRPNFAVVTAGKSLSVIMVVRSPLK